ncbi:MAG: alpha-glucosidase/alpha-galactosidase, partial [Clostridia bacterium]|nr:alpha-glucosidase/alpha-galactosidase [Clostridia bacterium]
MKVTFMGAGSTVFAKNVLGDIMLLDNTHDVEIALYDIDETRLSESYILIDAMNRSINESRATVKKYLGVENRKEALRGAAYVVNAIQVGLYDPCTIIDFEIPKKYGLRQTIGDTLGIGGVMRGLRTIQVMKGFARDMEEVCPDAILLNYTNPMAIVSGFMQRYSKIKTVGLCHSVQACTYTILTELGMNDKLDGRREII